MRKIPRNVWILGIVALLTDMSSEMIHSLLPLFLVTQLSANVMMVGVIEGIAESIASIMKVVSGALSDYLSRRKMLVVAGYSLSTISKPLFALAQNPLTVLIARTGDRIGKGVRGAPRDALVADSVTPDIRGAAYGLRQSLDTVGSILGPGCAFALMLASSDNFRLVFWIALIPAVVSVLLLIVGVREPELAVSRSKGVKKNPLEWNALKQLGSTFWTLAATAFIFNLGNSSDAFLLLRAQNAGIPAHMIPLTMVVMSIVYAGSAYPVGVLSDKLGRVKLLIGGFLVYVVVYAGFAYADNPDYVWGLFALYGLHLGMTQGLISAIVADKVPETQRGTAFGVVNLATGIALLPASLLAGYLWDNVSPQAPFIAGALFALTATLVFVAGSLLTRRS